MAKEQKPVYGGQAVIEGVMFAGQYVNVTAVRKKSTGEIVFYEVPRKPETWTRKLKKIPLLRGVVAIIEASARGSQHLNFSSEVYADDEGVDGQPKEDKKSLSNSLTMILGVAVVGVISFLFGKFIFTLVPAALEHLLFKDLFENQVLHNLLEGLIKIIFLIVYIYLIALTPLIRRLFQYHGAEHKVITAYESDLELTVKNVQQFNTLHYRCGSSFIVFTVLIGVLLYSFLHYDSMVERLVQRVYMLPLVIGISFEVLRFTNALREIPILRYAGYPGLWLQKLTTKEPSNDQVEVSIASFNRMLELDEQIRRERTAG